MFKTKKGRDGRFQFEFAGRLIYEWEQSLDDVNLYIKPPAGTRGENIDIQILPHHLRVGLRGAEHPFLDEETGGPVKLKDSTWTFSDGEINITLQKMLRAEVWDCALKGKISTSGVEAEPATAVDPLTIEEMKKKILLERFQEEVSDILFSTEIVMKFGLAPGIRFLRSRLQWGCSRCPKLYGWGEIQVNYPSDLKI
jgi:hypothetical protein